MGGIISSRNALNKALEKISTILNDSDIDDWFISYGTLLGVIREESCIDGDDDVDINISILDRMQLYFLLIGNGFEIWIDRPDFIKTIPTEEIGSIDFYFCEMDRYVCNDTWNKIIWNNYKDKDNNFLKKEWNSIMLNIPFNPKDKLRARYGNWETPSNSKMDGESPYNLP